MRRVNQSGVRRGGGSRRSWRSVLAASAMTAGAMASGACGPATEAEGPRVTSIRSTATAPVTASAIPSAEAIAPPAKPSLGATRVVLGRRAGCALLEGGDLSCWGARNAGTPRRVPGAKQVAHVAIGTDLLIVDREGAVSIVPGADLDGEARPFPSPSPVVGASSSDDTTCLVRRDGRVACWMSGLLDEKGQPKKAIVVPGLAGATAIAVGGGQGCAILSTRRVACFGIGSWTQQQLPDLEDVVEIAVNPHAACAREANARLTCYDLTGKKARLFQTQQADAVAMSGDTGDWPMICRGKDADVTCERPKAMEASYGIPAMKVGSFRLPDGRKVQQITATKTAACLLDDAATVRCWGLNAGSLLGRADTRWVDRPSRVPNLPRMQAVAAGDRFTCALATNTDLYCWGRLQSPISFDDAPELAPPARLQAATGAARIVGGEDYACLLSAAGEATCFYGRRESAFDPVRVPPFDGARAIALPPLGFANAVAAIDVRGQLHVGPTPGFDTLKGLVLTPVAAVPQAELLTIVSLGLGASPGSYGFVVAKRPDGKLVSVEVLEKGAAAPRTLQGCDGAIAIQASGMALLPDGKVVACGPRAAARTLVEKTPLVTLGDGERICGMTAAGAYGCVAPGDRFDVIFERPKQVASSDAHECAVMGDGEVWCRGANASGECGITAGVFKSETPLALHFD